jgi:micrococcal nuclease
MRRALALLLALLLTAAAACSPADLPAPQTPQPATYTVSSVYDGDTLRLAQQDASVRVLGIDAPELSPKECYGIQSRDAARGLLPVGTEVSLSADLAQESPDRYGRTLAYVTLPDGTDLAMRLLQAGAARTYPEYPVSKSPEYTAAQQLAQEERKGLWGLC